MVGPGSRPIARHSQFVLHRSSSHAPAMISRESIRAVIDLIDSLRETAKADGAASPTRTSR